MAPMKRPASAQAGPISKKPAKASGVSAKCKVVEKAILSAELPQAVTGLLTGNLMLTLGVCKEERVAIQEQFITMVGETLSGVEAAIVAKIAALEAKVAEAGTEKATRDAAAEEATATATAKKEATEAAKTAVSESTAALKSAKTALATAEAEQKAGDANAEALAANRTKLESALNGTYMPIKAGTAEPGQVKEGISALVKLGKEFEFDPSMLTSLPAALSKAVDARGTFDAMVLTKVEEDMNRLIAELDKEIANVEPAKAARASKVVEAQAVLEAAGTAETASKAALKEAQTAEKDAEAAKKAAAKSVKDFDPEMKQAAASLEGEKASLESLQTGALAAYKELLELSNVPPPEPEAPVEEVLAEAAPAEAAPVEAAV